MQVWKFPLYPDTTMKMPKGAKVLTVQVQGSGPCIWALVDPMEPEYEERVYSVVGTGWNADVDVSNYVGTFQLLEPDGLVFHVFER